MSLKAGTLVGPYEILSLLGAGGMGEVYRARDPRLNREAAIKILPEQFTKDTDRLRRFEQEARAAGMLNHPNIVTVHDIGTSNGTFYVVSELLEGETLRERLQSGGIPGRKAVEYALQIAHGLSAAHDKGIAHRDLKPENIFLTRDGRVKILDFGLAKLSAPEPAVVSEHSKLQTRDGGTEPGMVLGTVGYMAPEQVRGLPTDHRSDIFTLGAILYEMLTGKRAFHGTSSADTMSAILKEDPPDASVVNNNVSASLDHVIRHCLEKNPEERFQSARDLAFDLEMISGITNISSQQKALVVEPARKIPWKIVAPLLIVAAVLVSFWLGRRTAAIGAGGTSVTAPLDMHFQLLTDLAGEQIWPSIAPDGKAFVYVRWVKDQAHIFFSRVGGQKPIDLTEDSATNNLQPAFSPDGQQIAFRSDRNGGGIFLMGATGESVKRLSDFGFNPSWSPDGKEIVCATEGVIQPLGRGTVSQLYAINISNGARRLITKGDAVQPAWSPHGLRIAFWGLREESGQRDIWTIDSKGTAQGVEVTNDRPTDWNPFWSPDGKYLYFVSDRGGTMNLWRIPIDETSGKTLGTPESVTTPSVWSRHFSIAANGLIVFSALDQRSILQQVAFDPAKGKLNGEPQTIFGSADQFAYFELSPDRNWITYGPWWPQGDIYVARADGSEKRKVTDDPEKDRYPSWSPDGKDIVFMSDRSGRYDFWMIRPDGSGMHKITETTGRAMWSPYFSPDGRFLSANNGTGTLLFDTTKSQPWRNPEPLPAYPDSQIAFTGVSWSADSKSIVGLLTYQDSTTKKAIAKYSFDAKKYEEIPIPDVPLVVQQIPDSRVLILAENNRLLIFDLPTKKISEITLPPQPHITSINYDEIHKRLFLSGDSSESNIWLMQNKK